MATLRKTLQWIKIEDPTQLTPETFAYAVELSDIDTRHKITTALISLFAFGFVATLTLIFLCGFGIVKFSEGFLKWLGGATIGEIGGLLLIAVSAIFRKNTQIKKK